MIQEELMQKVLALAKKGQYTASPNPMVGAILIKNGEIIAQGYHHRAGLPHAEIMAIKEAGKNAEGSTLYVNLEPCRHYGRTPPCTQAIIKAGIKEVIIGMLDPYPEMQGKSLTDLKAAGLEVKYGVLEDKCKELNIAYITRITKKRPYITLKIASTLDGKIAPANKKSVWITNDLSREEVHKLRAKVDAILVGINTVLEDNPLLTVRTKENLPENYKPPRRIILDSQARLPLASNIVQTAKEILTMVVVDENIADINIRKLEKNNLTVLKVKSSANNKLDLNDLMEKLSKQEINHLLVEGGAQVFTSFFEARLVDQLYLFIAPKIMGGINSLSWFLGSEKKLANGVYLKNINISRFKEDILITGIPEWNNDRKGKASVSGGKAGNFSYTNS